MLLLLSPEQEIIILSISNDLIQVIFPQLLILFIEKSCFLIVSIKYIELLLPPIANVYLFIKHIIFLLFPNSILFICFIVE